MPAASIAATIALTGRLENAADVPPTSEIDLSEIKSTYYDGVELNVAEELKRNNTWFENGECPGPTAIGKIEVPSHLLEQLAAELDFDYFRLEQGPADDDSEYAYYSEREVDGDIVTVPLSPQSNAILLHISEAFAQVKQMDIDGSTNPSTFLPSSPDFSAGVYREENTEVHIDRSIGPIRYVATIVGPPTEFTQGTIIDTSIFDTEDGGLVLGAKVDNPLKPTNVLEICRFLGDADPHTPPVCLEPTFRIFVADSGYITSDKI